MTDRVAVDWTACRARGVCSELLPERITLDEWGYPLIDAAPLPADVQPYARQAVSACPTRALRLERLPASESAARTQPAARFARQAGDHTTTRRTR